MKTRLLTRPDLAAALGVAVRTTHKFELDGMPIAVKGAPGKPTRYDLPQCIEWLIARRVASHGPEGELNPQRERALLDQARREELELKIRVRKGELIESAEAEREFADIAHSVKSRLRAIPSSVADRVLGLSSPAHVQQFLLNEIDAALTELARGFTESEPPELSRLAEPGDDESDKA